MGDVRDVLKGINERTVYSDKNLMFQDSIPDCPQPGKTVDGEMVDEYGAGRGGSISKMGAVNMGANSSNSRNDTEEIEENSSSGDDEGTRSLNISASSSSSRDNIEEIEESLHSENTRSTRRLLERRNGWDAFMRNVTTMISRGYQVIIVEPESDYIAAIVHMENGVLILRPRSLVSEVIHGFSDK